MLYFTISIIIGLILGGAATATHLKKTHTKLLNEQKNNFLHKISDLESNYNQLSSEFNVMKSETENQKELTVQKIGDAFHAGSEMMEVMGAGLGRIQQLVSNTSTPIQNIFENGNEALEIINSSRIAMEKMSSSLTQLNDISSLVNELCENMNQVNAKTDAIHNIANQANLLSLNAAIEAARAGEAGRGFSVVANDMNRLSELSATAAQDISKILSSGIKNIEKITVEMDDKILIFNEVSSDVLGCFEKMNGSVHSISKLTESLNSDSTRAIDGVKTVSDKTQTTMESLTKMLSDVTGIISGHIITDISPTEIAGHISDYTIIDVRGQNEFNDELSHISSATLCCLQDNFKEAIANMNKDDKYLFVCRSGGRSARGARIAQALGFNDVSNLSGGMLEWRKSFPL